MANLPEPTDGGPIDPEWTLGDRLRKGREYAGLTQGEMAERLGVSRASVSAWETGAHKPVRDGWDMLKLTRRYSEETGIRVEWFRRTAQVDSLHLVPIPDGQLDFTFDPPPTLEVVECQPA